jgi:two-component system, cell cycle sensor histidine kinase and response regulator CckA
MDDRSFMPNLQIDAERLLASLFRHMAEGVALHELVYDASGKPVDYRTLAVNPPYQGCTGLPPEQVVGRLATEAFGTPEPPHLAELSAVALSGRASRLDVYTPALDRHFVISITPLGPGLFATIFFDVSEQKRHELALRKNEERFRKVFNFAPDPLTISTPDGRLLNCNEAFCKVAGFSEAELVGRTTADIGLWIDKKQREVMYAELAQMGGVDGVEAQMKRKDGNTRLIRLSARRVEIGGQAFLLSAARDVTEQRNLEQQVLHTQKLESLGVLAGGIAHDFNNLLTGVLGNADLVLAELSPVAPARESLQAIGIAARRAAELCRQLLAYSGKGRFLVQPLDVQELVQEMGHLLSVSISKKVVLKYDFAKDLPAIEADATQMRQTIMNLILNASEAIGDRSGVISVTTGLAYCNAAYLKTCFAADAIQPGDFVFVEVADTGHGMDKATQDRIFDPFFTTKFTGRGLGLAAVLGIVRGHKGAIKVCSEVGRGATFRLLFPATEAKARPGASTKMSAQVWRGHGKILVVDDEETVRNLTRRMLERAGFTVLAAEDGRQAVEIFKQVMAEVDLVILDLTMPHLDGEACFRELRLMKPEVRVILSSGYNEQDVVNLFVGEGLAGFIQKPYTSDELITKVRDVLVGQP